ncbi:hypothetical protein [Serratia fonticola]|uniref:Uncharacterized protein n=1 Tax=Serratia fonticola TaxID=47917 RepID=A0AAW3WWH5_SERFO|nr:hypothetical protein [Serratia fonticola]MBC3214777.1 hypothetical protein [Serratia fonticola]NYA15830.1 hypothetical protein [Serratia fonticola]NYA35698.1 hypothetical protein [Serratia fonticola]
MGFINHIKYDKPLPGNDDNEKIELITKDLEFGCLFYEISDTGRLLRDNEDGTFTDMNFKGQLYVYAEQGAREYFMFFNDTGTLDDVTEVPDYAHYCRDLSTPYREQ